MSNLIDTASSSQNVEDNVSLIKRMRGKLDIIDPSLSSKHCVYRIPQRIRELNQKSYDPCVISIGPFHNGNIRFKSMERFKSRYLNKVIQRNNNNPDSALDSYFRFLKDCENKVRQCYAGLIDMTSDDFVSMLLLDSFFIIELLLCFQYQELRNHDHDILSATRLSLDLQHDLILLENQIPFYVLQGLFDLTNTDYQGIPLLNLALSFFSNFNAQEKSLADILPKHLVVKSNAQGKPMDAPEPREVDDNRDARGKSIVNIVPAKSVVENSSFAHVIRHFTDLVLIFLRPKEPTEGRKKYKTTKTVTELDEAGVKFKMSKSKCLLDIKFKNGVLELPAIKLDDDTNFLIRNLIALEVCHYPQESYIIDYMYFMDDLINTAKDVDLLVQSNIIDNWLGDSKEAATLFNDMNTNIRIKTENYYYSDLCKKLDSYCLITNHRYRAVLNRDYFSTPCRSASTIAAFILLVLTFIQTIFTITSFSMGK